MKYTVLKINLYDKSFQKTACLQAFSKNFLSASLFKKGLSENPQATLEFEGLIPKPYRRDKPAQRFRLNGCRSTVSGQWFF
jgi:hypothetical protein